MATWLFKVLLKFFVSKVSNLCSLAMYTTSCDCGVYSKIKHSLEYVYKINDEVESSAVLSIEKSCYSRKNLDVNQ